MEVFEAAAGYSASTLKYAIITVMFMLLGVIGIVSYYRTRKIPVELLKITGVLTGLVILVENL